MLKKISIVLSLYHHMILNRQIAPSTQIDKIDFPEVLVQENFHYIQGATQEYTFLQLIFDAGKIHTDKKLVADACCDMLLSGTSTKTAFELNELLDYYGASIEPIMGEDDLTIRIYCLNKQLPNILPIIHEILTDSIFPEDEAKIILAKWKQKQLINFKKTDYLANRKFKNLLFGDAHPYGALINQADFDEVQLKDILGFYETNIKNKNCKIILTGKLSDTLIQSIKKTFANQKENVDVVFNNTIDDNKNYSNIENMEDTVQSSIRVGKLLCNMNHEDYMGLYTLTCILGGYFSSRLMNNLREDKGYTYGVHATLYSRKFAGVLEISTEVNKEHRENAINEIKNEINRLINKEVEEEELDKVKNYLLGQMMRSMDGPIKTGKIYKTLLMQNLSFNFSKQFEQKIKTISSKELNELAKKYYQIDTMHIVCIG